MATISAQAVKELRDKTGAGMMDCKAALGETDGDLEKAVDWLRKKGLAKAANKAGRTTADGLIGLAQTATKGVVVEVNSETDFVARNEFFQGLVRMIADVALTAGTDVEVIKQAKIGKLTVAEAIAESVAKIGENMTLRRAASLEVGTGVVASYVHNSVAEGLGKIGVIVALESAILFQTGLDEIFDAVILVEASNEDIIRREEAAGKFTREDIINRLEHQHSPYDPIDHFRQLQAGRHLDG